MKYFSLLIVSMCMCYLSYAQNGTFRSTLFEFRSENEPFRNRTSQELNTFIFQITERQGEFMNGKVMWEMQSDGQSGWLEMRLKTIKNAHFDDSSNAFIKSYIADILIDGEIIINGAEVNIWRFTNNNTYRIEFIDIRKKTINRWDNLKKI